MQGEKIDLSAISKDDQIFCFVSQGYENQLKMAHATGCTL